MNYYRKISGIAVLLILMPVFFFPAIRAEEHKIEKLKITIPAGISLMEGEIRERLPEDLTRIKNDYDTIEIVIYYYSIGTEKLSYGDEENFGLTSNDGKIMSLIKLSKNGALQRVIFIDAAGSGKDEILSNFSRAVSASRKDM